MVKNLIGRYGFIAGLVLAAIIALFGSASWILLLLVALGLIVGLMNITGSEAVPFLVSVIAIIVGGTGMLSVFSGLPGMGVVMDFLQGIVLFSAAAAIPVAFRGLFSTMHGR